jgi:V/A-type H+-transporting ATPase subunit A
MSERAAGTLTEIAGAVVRAARTECVSLGEVVYVGGDRLLAEVIALEGPTAVLQVYEDTAGLHPGEPFFATGLPLSMELGPGLLGGIFDGVGRPLPALARAHGDFLGRGSRQPALDREKIWEFTPRVAAGEAVSGGASVGEVPETPSLVHRVLVPPDVSGRIREVAAPGPKRVGDVVARVETAAGIAELRLFQTWRVRTPRPVTRKLASSEPLITGQRVLDTFFPLPRGSAAGMPGGFGTGKTVTQQQLCKQVDADVIVYVGCGERGNEMTHVLEELPALVDPRHGRPLSERTVLIANTSNMPVAAREASIYTGITVAEYFRDMGHHVALMADSTSRWAEALREISGRLEEMPAEEGYPPYLASRLAAFYERAGHVVTLGGGDGSVSIISAISPPGGDVTEPVSRHTQRFTPTFWRLSKERAEARVFPAVDIQESYGEVPAELEAWWSRTTSPEWSALRREALGLLETAAVLERTARLVGAESLPERERFLLRMASLFEEGFLRQSAFDPKDAFCSPRRQLRLLRLFLRFRDRGLAAIEGGVEEKRLGALPALARLERAKSQIGEDELARFDELESALDGELAALVGSER